MRREVEGTEKAVSAMGSWTPSDLAYIERLDFRVGAEASASAAIVGLFQRRGASGWPDANGPMHRATLLFEGVRGLRLTGFGGGAVQITGFDIHSIADRGWEDVYFEIEDYETDRLGFTCGRVVVLEVDAQAVYLP
jgi:hypothetical protein